MAKRQKCPSIAYFRRVKCLRRHKGIDKVKDEALDDMDFVWDTIRYQFEQVMLPACQFYVQNKGNLNTIPRAYKIPKGPGRYPTACRGYSLGDKLYKWREHGARLDLMEEIEALGFKPNPVSFSPQDLTTLLTGFKWFHDKFGYKERVNMLKTPTCLSDDHPTLPGLPFGKLFQRAKQWDEKVGFSEADRKKLEVFASWNTIYQSTIFPLMETYSNLNGNLRIQQRFQVPSCSPWPTWSWQQNLGLQAVGIRQGSMTLSEEEKDILDSMDFKWGPKGRIKQIKFSLRNK